MTLYDVSDATQTVYDAVGEDSETNIIFGAVTDPAMNGKIRVTVIATGFNDESLEIRREAAAPKLVVKLPGSGKKEPEKIEQMSISLGLPSKSETHERIVETVAIEKPRMSNEVEDESVAMRGEESISTTASNSNSSIEFPAFLKKENMRKERVYVSKGSVITQYEDDMDVPTFLRKQMQ
jgi:cell division protein FtsZ